MDVGGMQGRRLRPDDVVEVGAISDARLSALAPRPVRAGSWWSAARAPVTVDPGRATPVHGRDEDAPAPERLAAVRRVLHEATSVVTWTDGSRRSAFVVAGEIVLIDTLSDGLHHLTLAGLAAAAAVLAIGLDPQDVARHGASPRPTTGAHAATDRPTAGREPVRRSLVHLVRVTTGPPAGELVLTVVGRDDGLELVRALPDGREARRTIDRDAVVAAAVALLTGPPEAVAA